MAQSSKVSVAQLGNALTGMATKNDLRFRKNSDKIVSEDLDTTLSNVITNKADSATTLDGYGINDAYTKTEVDNAIDQANASVYKPGGSIAAAEIVAALLVVGNLGKVYNASDDFTTTSDFVEGAGKVHPAGTNVVIVDTDTTGQTPNYKFDVLAGAYGVATTSGNGLMSATDKTKLDGITDADDAEITAIINGLYASE